MYITVVFLKETKSHERRVAVTPSVAAQLIEVLGAKVQMQSGAAESIDLVDSAYHQVEAFTDRIALVRKADVVLAVHAPALEVIDAMQEGAILISFIDLAADPALLRHLQARKITSFSMEHIPSIPRAAPMHALACQAALHGYRAVLLGAMQLARCLPELTTAAGVIGPARVLVLGLGLAGLEATASATRMGAVVDGYDPCPDARSRAKAQGVSVIADAVESETSSDQPADAHPEEWTRVDDVITWHLHQADLIIITESISSHVPKNITRLQVAGMKVGAVVIDLIRDGQGKCELSRPGEQVRIGPVTILAPLDLVSQAAADASELYARNLYHLLATMMRDQLIALDWNDEILVQSVVTHAGVAKNCGASSPPETAAIDADFVCPV